MTTTITSTAIKLQGWMRQPTVPSGTDMGWYKGRFIDDLWFVMMMMMMIILVIIIVIVIIIIVIIILLMHLDRS